jgi:GalNAc-alpha-(1->4)-GalNAc-alpha-(1->3)-diNAcBac-PP-undecaprenol alpha-1,4-N-acetyl-D-galactosaminyltransferase
MDGWLIKFWKMVNRKILIINNGLAGGGIERASVSLSNYFSELGYPVTILALYQSKHVFRLNEQIQFIEPKFERTRFNKYYYVLNMMLFIRKNVRKLKPDSILSYGEWTNPFVIFALRGLGIPLFLSDRMNPLAKLPFVSELLRKRLYKKATGIIAQTEFAKEILTKRTKSNNIKVIPNPLNLIERVNCESKNIIVSVGRLSIEKGHKYLIEAFSKVKDKKWKLSIVGDGNERENLFNLCVQLGIKGRVKFHGHQKDFSQQLSESKIFVLPSLKEGFPNALIEAMAFPLPCISTDFLGAKNEIMEDGVNGLIVKTANSEELALAIDRLILNIGSLRKKLTENGVKIREKLCFEVIAQQYLDFIFNKNE